MIQIYSYVDDAGNRVGSAIDNPKVDIVSVLALRSSIEGKFCRLEPLSETHFEDLYTAFQPDNDRMWAYLPVGPFSSTSQFSETLSRLIQTPNSLFFAIISTSTGKAVGVSSYINNNTTNRSVEVGFLMFSRYMQRSSIATEAMYLMMSNAFETGYRRYEWKCNALNQPSINAAQRLGFSFEGLFRNAAIVKGRSRDTAWFSIIDQDWPGIRQAMLEWLSAGNFNQDGAQVASLSTLTSPYVVSRFPALNVIRIDV